MENPLSDNATLPGYCMREVFHVSVECLFQACLSGNMNTSEAALTLTLNGVKSKW